MTQPTQEYIESRLASVEPDVEVLLVEQVSPGKVRLFIDCTDGVVSIPYADINRSNLLEG